MSAISAELRRARPEDWPAVLALLAECGLPTEDLREASMATFIVAETATGSDARHLVAVAGLDTSASHDAAGLLRSTAVRAAYRARGLARRVVEDCERLALELGLAELYLLAKDEAAAAFFRHAGYVHIQRAEVPASVQANAEFGHLCPQSSPCLRKSLAR